MEIFLQLPKKSDIIKATLCSQSKISYRVLTISEKFFSDFFVFLRPVKHYLYESFHNELKIC